MGKVIACVNEKGGVAKTTTIKNLSVGIAMKGYKVLVVDLDPSANLTKCLGLSQSGEEGTICEIIGAYIECEDVPEGFGIVKSEEGIDVITSSNALHCYESKLAAAYQREVVLRRYINTIKDKYDFIFLDCPAGLGIFVDNALFAADSIIIPTEPEQNRKSEELYLHRYGLVPKITVLLWKNLGSSMLADLISSMHIFR